MCDHYGAADHLVKEEAILGQPQSTELEETKMIANSSKEGFPSTVSMFATDEAESDQSGLHTYYVEHQYSQDMRIKDLKELKRDGSLKDWRLYILSKELEKYEREKAQQEERDTNQKKIETCPSEEKIRPRVWSIYDQIAKLSASESDSGSDSEDIKAHKKHCLPRTDTDDVIRWDPNTGTRECSNGDCECLTPAKNCWWRQVENFKREVEALNNAMALGKSDRHCDKKYEKLMDDFDNEDNTRPVLEDDKDDLEDLHVHYSTTEMLLQLQLQQLKVLEHVMRGKNKAVLKLMNGFLERIEQLEGASVGSCCEEDRVKAASIVVKDTSNKDDLSSFEVNDGPKENCDSMGDRLEKHHGGALTARDISNKGDSSGLAMTATMETMMVAGSDEASGIKCTSGEKGYGMKDNPSNLSSEDNGIMQKSSFLSTSEGRTIQKSSMLSTETLGGIVNTKERQEDFKAEIFVLNEKIMYLQDKCSELEDVIAKKDGRMKIEEQRNQKLKNDNEELQGILANFIAKISVEKALSSEQLLSCSEKNLKLQDEINNVTARLNAAQKKMEDFQSCQEDETERVCFESYEQGAAFCAEDFKRHDQKEKFNDTEKLDSDREILTNFSTDSNVRGVCGQRKEDFVVSVYQAVGDFIVNQSISKAVEKIQNEERFTKEKDSLQESVIVLKQELIMKQEEITRLEKVTENDAKRIESIMNELNVSVTEKEGLRRSMGFDKENIKHMITQIDRMKKRIQDRKEGEGVENAKGNEFELMCNQLKWENKCLLERIKRKENEVCSSEKESKKLADEVKILKEDGRRKEADSECWRSEISLFITRQIIQNAVRRIEMEENVEKEKKLRRQREKGVEVLENEIVRHKEKQLIEENEVNANKLHRSEGEDILTNERLRKIILQFERLKPNSRLKISEAKEYYESVEETIKELLNNMEMYCAIKDIEHEQHIEKLFVNIGKFIAEQSIRIGVREVEFKERLHLQEAIKEETIIALRKEINEVKCKDVAKAIAQESFDNGRREFEIERKFKLKIAEQEEEITVLKNEITDLECKGIGKAIAKECIANGRREFEIERKFKLRIAEQEEEISILKNEIKDLECKDIGKAIAQECIENGRREFEVEKKFQLQLAEKDRMIKALEHKTQEFECIGIANVIARQSIDSGKVEIEMERKLKLQINDKDNEIIALKNKIEDLERQCVGNILMQRCMDGGMREIEMGRKLKLHIAAKDGEIAALKKDVEKLKCTNFAKLTSHENIDNEVCKFENERILELQVAAKDKEIVALKSKIEEMNLIDVSKILAQLIVKNAKREIEYENRQGLQVEIKNNEITALKRETEDLRERLREKDLRMDDRNCEHVCSKENDREDESKRISLEIEEPFGKDCKQGGTSNMDEEENGEADEEFFPRVEEQMKASINEMLSGTGGEDVDTDQQEAITALKVHCYEVVRILSSFYRNFGVVNKQEKNHCILTANLLIEGGNEILNRIMQDNLQDGSSSESERFSEAESEEKVSMTSSPQTNMAHFTETKETMVKQSEERLKLLAGTRHEKDAELDSLRYLIARYTCLTSIARALIEMGADTEDLMVYKAKNNYSISLENVADSKDGALIITAEDHEYPSRGCEEIRRILQGDFLLMHELESIRNLFFKYQTAKVTSKLKQCDDHSWLNNNVPSIVHSESIHSVHSEDSHYRLSNIRYMDSLDCDVEHGLGEIKHASFLYEVNNCGYAHVLYQEDSDSSIQSKSSSTDHTDTSAHSSFELKM